MTTAVTTDNARRRPKGNKRERTRAALLEAARALIREKGYERTTMEEVARRAGMTGGGLYGNFKNRDELFIALGQTYWAPIKPMIRPGSSFADKMRAMAEATIAALPERRVGVVGRLTGMAYALSHEALRTQVHETTAASYGWGAGWLRSVGDDGQLPMPAELLVVVIHSLTEGLVFQRLMTPDLVPDEVFYAAFAALARPAEATNSQSAT
ncbi:MAG TPA: TetR/AcrR family transcriptional regulator [Caulobacteraceae bacterium]